MMTNAKKNTKIYKTRCNHCRRKIPLALRNIRCDACGLLYCLSHVANHESETCERAIRDKARAQLEKENPTVHFKKIDVI